MDLDRILLVPSKSRYEIGVTKYGSVENAQQNCGSQRVWEDSQTGHVAQKSNLKKVTNKLGYNNMIDRSLLVADIIRD